MEEVISLTATGTAGSPLLPGVPSFSELGIKGLEKDSWVAFFAPLGTPAAVIEKFSTDLQKVLTMPEVHQRFNDLGLIATGSTPQSLSQRIKSDKAYWAEAIKITGIKAK